MQDISFDAYLNSGERSRYGHYDNWRAAQISCPRCGWLHTECECEDETDCEYECGGMMRWCSICEMYSRDCCEEYGSCQCS